jgi:hypothetical protein
VPRTTISVHANVGITVTKKYTNTAHCKASAKPQEEKAESNIASWMGYIVNRMIVKDAAQLNRLPGICVALLIAFNHDLGKINSIENGIITTTASSGNKWSVDVTS